MTCFEALLAILLMLILPLCNIGTIDYNRFLEYLEDLNVRGIKYLLSFDGIRGNEDYTVDLPKELYKRHEFIPSGNSTFKKVIDKETEKVLESLYLNY